MSKLANIYIIYGASGSGKTTLISELGYLNIKVTVHAKGTTRKLRAYDEEEIVSVADVTSPEYDYIYANYGNKYGIQKSQIDASLSAGKHHFIICNDKPTIKKIKDDFPNRTRVIYLAFDMPEKILKQIQSERDISDDEIKLRLEKIKYLNEEFLADRGFFDAVIINKFGFPPARMLTQLRSLIDSDTEDASDTEIEQMRVELTALTDLVTQINKNTTPSIHELGAVPEGDFVFIVMAMIKDDDLLIAAHESIKRACAATGYDAHRIDDTYYGSEIPPKILNNIKLASIVVADLTLERPNTYFELGYAVAYNKNVIITARENTVVHFDVNAYQRIIYKNARELERELTDVLRSKRSDEEVPQHDISEEDKE
jgi:guanylate kinase